MAFSQADMEAFGKATPEDPVLIKGTFWTEHPVSGQEMIASRGTAAIIGPYEIDDPYGYDEERFRVAYLDQKVIGDPDMVRRRFGDWDIVKLSDIPDGEVVFDPAVEARYKDFQDMHNNTPFTVVGRLYSEDATYLAFDQTHDYPQYAEIEGTEKTWDLKDATLKDGSPVKSLEAVDKWMLENHPAYYMGYSAAQDCPSGDFVVNVVPGMGYPKGMDDTFAHRMDYAKMHAVEMGVQIGPDETRQVLADARAKQELPKKERRLPDISNIVDIPNGPDYMMPGDY